MNDGMTQKPISSFIEKHYRHFNAWKLLDAARAYKKHVESGGKMMVALAGAMSTAELGLSLADMIRADKVHAITCTGANLEEDAFNLVAHSHYKKLPRYRNLTPQEEKNLYDQGLNRVTDTCIPEGEAMRRIKKQVLKKWKAADAEGIQKLPHEYLYELILDGELEDQYDIDPKDSWLVQAAKKKLPLFVPGWEDSTLGNMAAAAYLKGELKNLNTIKGGLHYMTALSNWYKKEATGQGIGLFQIGGGIAGDFPICVVPMIKKDMKQDVPFWAYFCQISDSTTSYGSYSGAVPNEKITWGKLDVDTPRFIIESDATIVAPLVFAYVLDW